MIERMRVKCFVVINGVTVIMLTTHIILQLRKLRLTVLEGLPNGSVEVEPGFLILFLKGPCSPGPQQ